METFPLTVQDNFFINPDKILEYAKSLEYGKNANGQWPGQRTRFIHEINNTLFLQICNKILSPFSEIGKIPSYAASGNFQLIPAGEYTDGIVHTDNPAVATAIIYLNPNGDFNTGTSLFKIKNNVFGIDYNDAPNYHDPDFEEKKSNWNSQFEETCRIGGYYNRLFLFDSNEYHAANEFNNQLKEDRYTLTIFFFEIDQSIYPSLRSKRILI